MRTKTNLAVFTLGLALILAPPGLAGTNHPPQAGFGTALQFDGANDCVSLSAALATNVGGRDAITIEYWFKGAQLQSPVRFQDGDGYIVAGWNENSPVHIISTDGGTDTGLSVGPESTVENGQWHHLAMTWQRNTVNGFRSYLDGALVAQRDSADVALPSLGSATPYLGCLWGSSEFLAGQLDEVRIWKTALSGTVVSNWMYRSADPTHPAWSNLVAYYKLNEGTGTNATDSAGTNTGTLVNMSGSAWTDSTVGRQYAVTAGQSVGGQLPGSDEDGASSNGANWALTFEIVNSGAHGTATVVSANVFTYSASLAPDTNDTFTYRVRDPSNAVSGVATVTVAIASPPPFVDITNANDSVSGWVTTYGIGGTNNQWVTGTMRWTNALTGSNGTLAATSPWSVANIALAFGDNTITVRGTNYAGVAASDGVTITRRRDAGAGSPMHYVWTNSPTPAWPYTNWATAAHTIQEAVNAAWDNDTVLVTNGTYNAGGDATPGSALSNRVCITGGVTVQSANGPSNTFIVGAGPNGDGAVRCAYLASGAVLAGFTLTNGHTRTESYQFEPIGGGVLLDGGGTVSDCTFVANSAASCGGGACVYYGGSLRNCVFSGNTSSGDGGGLYFMLGGELCNGTVSGNAATNWGGGVYCLGGTVVNSIVWSNTAGVSGNNVYLESGGALTFCCTTPNPGGSGNITNDPQFVDAPAGNYRLAPTSPCINAGTNQTWMTSATDLDGRPRIIGGNVDMGAYEYSGAPVVTITNTVTTVPSAQTTIVIGGTNNLWVAGTMSYTNAANGAAGTFAAQPKWTTPAIALAYGDNPITVRGTNIYGAVASSSITIMRQPLVSYVSVTGSNIWPYGTWANAATTIQAAVDAAPVGGTVWVTNGTYSVGGAVTPGYALSNRVCITKAITVQSVNGPTNTCIAGAGPNGAAAVRCAYLSGDAVLAGFTLTNGHTLTSGSLLNNQSGGGTFLDDGGTLSNCVVTGNAACYWAGGVESLYGTLYNCLIRGNYAQQDGGGMLCLESALNNCTIVAKTAEQKGGGVYFDLSDTSTLRNTILYGNFAWGGGGNYANYYNADLVTFCCCCTTPDPGGAGNITNDPRFVNAAAGNYRLSAASPCINAGTNGTWVTVTDLDGGPRIRGGTVDMGAYECGDPLVTITNTVTVVPPTQTTIVIGGAKNPLVVGAMLYTNAATGASGSFPAQMSWTTPALSLAYGDNRITITGTNAEGGTASASITIWRDMTPPGNALAFDGTNDYVQIADANSLDLTNNYTLEAWINVDSFKWLGGIIGKYQVASANGYVLRLGKYGAYDGINFDQMDTATNLLQSNRWYHVAGVNSNGTRRLYLNGVEQVLSGTPLTIQANTNILTLGVDFLADPRYFDGRMDEVRIWNVVRSEAQIRDAMHKELAGTETGLVAYYQFNYASGTTPADLTTNGNTGTLVNGPVWTNSTSPCAELIANRANLRGAWLAQTNSLASSILSVSNAAVTGAAFRVFGHDNGALTQNTTDKPAGYAWRLNRAWQTEGTGAVTGTWVFDCAGITNFIQNSALLRLMTDADGTFANAGSVAGNYAAGVFSVAGQSLPASGYYTIGERTSANWILVASAGAHGSIAPSGNVAVANGGKTNFTVTPATYWHVGDVTTNGVSVGAVTAFTWSNVVADGTIHAAFAADTAAGGTPHWWLAQYGLTNGGWTFDHAETNNPDHDPFNSHDEHICDTDPTNPASYFQITAVSNLPPWRVYFGSSSNRQYSLDYRPSLLTGDWSQISDQTNKAGNGGTFWLTDTNAVVTNRFYRVEVGL